MKAFFLLLLSLIATNGFAQAANDAPFTYVEVMPVFPGGDKALDQFLADEFKSQTACAKEDKKAYVVLQFVVDTSGYVKSPQVIKGLDCCNKEALRVVNLINDRGLRWVPGSHNNRKVNVLKTVVVRCQKK
jgi:hypothetical protein